ncbi:MAG: 50S ribosomal protein L17 [Thermodesulfobacteriota bacterium]
MRHRKARTKLGMRTPQRQAMLRNMVTSLMEHESIITTDARAKALRSLGDRMITLGKRGDLHARRLVLRVFRSKEVARRLFEEIAPRYANREGGYVRILKKGVRPGDGAAVSIVELVEKSPAAAAGKPSKGKKGIKDRLMDTLKSK